jgi:hypothetical protein
MKAAASAATPLPFQCMRLLDARVGIRLFCASMVREARLFGYAQTYSRVA